MSRAKRAEGPRPPAPVPYDREWLATSNAPGRGIALILLAGLVFTINDSIMKWLRTEFSVGQAVGLRGVFSLSMILTMTYFVGGWNTLRVKRWGPQLLRCLLVIVTTVSFTTALRYMPLADVMGIAFAGPLFTVAFAVPLLGERVGWRRWTAVGFGFAGVLLMVKPTGAGFQLAAILPLCTALGGALRDILTRRMSMTDHSNATLAVSVLAVTVFGLSSYPLGWVFPTQAWIWPTGPHLALFTVSGVLMSIGQYCTIESVRLAQVGLVAPFKYTSYVWAIMLGFAIWGDIPSLLSIIGVCFVIGSGLFIFWREQRAAQ